MDFTPGVTIYSPEDDGVGPVAISKDDSMIVVGTGQAIGNGSIYVFNQQGATMWNYSLNHFVSSVSMSSNGSMIAVSGYQIAAGPGGVYENPAIYLFNGRGTLLWNQSFGGQFAGASLTSNGSRLVVMAENAILLMNDDGKTLWSFTPGNRGTIYDWVMSPDGSRLVVSVQNYSQVGNNSLPSSRSWLYFNLDGEVVANRTFPQEGPLTPGNLALSSDGKYIWSSEATSGTSGSLLLFDYNGSLLWSRPIYSPALEIQTLNGSQDAAVETNWSTLVFNDEGQQLANYTGSQQSAAPASASGSSCTPTSFSMSDYTSPGVVFLNAQGVAVSSYSFNRIVSNIALSANGRFAGGNLDERKTALPCTFWTF